VTSLPFCTHDHPDTALEKHDKDHHHEMENSPDTVDDYIRFSQQLVGVWVAGVLHAMIYYYWPVQLGPSNPTNSSLLVSKRARRADCSYFQQFDRMCQYHGTSRNKSAYFDCCRCYNFAFAFDISYWIARIGLLFELTLSLDSRCFTPDPARMSHNTR
jgi:hypothetical protein